MFHHRRIGIHFGEGQSIFLTPRTKPQASRLQNWNIAHQIEVIYLTSPSLER